LFLVRRRQHLDGAADLLVAADDRVELALARGLGQVAGIFLQRLIAFLGRGAVGGAASCEAKLIPPEYGEFSAALKTRQYKEKRRRHKPPPFDQIVAGA
jgi:hypothetical protein